MHLIMLVSISRQSKQTYCGAPWLVNFMALIFSTSALPIVFDLPKSQEYA
jgi:hypothetical protein